LDVRRDALQRCRIEAPVTVASHSETSERTMLPLARPRPHSLNPEIPSLLTLTVGAPVAAILAPATTAPPA
jgi:hypothetical protein